jgi:hypothetical protein
VVKHERREVSMNEGAEERYQITMEAAAGEALFVIPGAAEEERSHEDD